MKEICITKMDDGTFTVSDDTGEQGQDGAAQSAIPGAIAQETEPKGQAYQSIDEALQAAKAMLMQTEAGMADQADQQAGFNSVMGA